MPDYLSTQPGEPGNSHLSSNNPFRNRAASPSFPHTTTSPFADPKPATSSARPVSRNPFLDPANGSAAPPKSNSDLLIDLDDMPAQTQAKEGKPSFMTDIFSSMNIEDKTIPATKSTSGGDNAQSRRPMDDRAQSSSRPSGRGRPSGGPPPRAKNIPPRRSPSPSRRPSRPQEEASKRHHPSNSAVSGRPAQHGPAPDRPSGRRPSVSSRPRRNSESSVAGGSDANLPNSEKILRDARRREQTLREKSSTRPSRRNDIIDQLDATSIFGNVFHHDGPFDALNPHRNRHNRRAPMQAFPKDSLNNVLGGSGPLNTRPDHKTFMGQGEDEAFRDFATSREKVSSSANPLMFDPLTHNSIVHGDESLGLGTSTFLEGTPAARTTIQRREAEKVQDIQENSMQRKKSIAQRFRTTKRGPRDNASRAFSTDGTPIESRSRGYGTDRPPRQFEEYDSSRAEETISVHRKAPAVPGSPPSPPQYDMERRATLEEIIPMTDAPRHGHSATVSGGGAGDDAQKSSSGLLARVKSLKGGRRAAPPPPMKDS